MILKSILLLLAFILPAQVSTLAEQPSRGASELLPFDFNSPAKIHEFLKYYPALTTEITSWSLAHGRPLHSIDRLEVSFRNLSETYTPDDRYPTMTRTRQLCRVEARVWPIWQNQEEETSNFVVHHIDRTEGCSAARFAATRINNLED